MTKTTTTCDHCRKEIFVGKPDVNHFLLKAVTYKPRCGPSPLREINYEFCSRSCLAEYLKPKTETTP